MYRACKQTPSARPSCCGRWRSSGTSFAASCSSASKWRRTMVYALASTSFCCRSRAFLKAARPPSASSPNAWACARTASSSWPTARWPGIGAQGGGPADRRRTVLAVTQKGMGILQALSASHARELDESGRNSSALWNTSRRCVARAATAPWRLPRAQYPEPVRRRPMEESPGGRVELSLLGAARFHGGPPCLAAFRGRRWDRRGCGAVLAVVLLKAIALCTNIFYYHRLQPRIGRAGGQPAGSLDGAGAGRWRIDRGPDGALRFRQDSRPRYSRGD